MTLYWQSYETKLRECPYCWATSSEAHTCNDTPRPVPGNFNLCNECGCVSVFTEQDQLREASEEEFKVASTLEDLVYAQRLILDEIAAKNAL